MKIITNIYKTLSLLLFIIALFSISYTEFKYNIITDELLMLVFLLLISGINCIYAINIKDISIE